MNMIVLSDCLDGAETQPAPTQEEIQAAVELLRRSKDLGVDFDHGAAGGDLLESPRLELNRTYPEKFVPDNVYKASIPDLQNGPESLIKGARRELQHVGISNFRLPIFETDKVAIVFDGETFLGLITRIDLLNYLRRRMK